jgi:hypothetical protein
MRRDNGAFFTCECRGLGIQGLERSVHDCTYSLDTKYVRLSDDSPRLQPTHQRKPTTNRVSESHRMSVVLAGK